MTGETLGGTQFLAQSSRVVRQMVSGPLQSLGLRRLEQSQCTLCEAGAEVRLMNITTCSPQRCCIELLIYYSLKVWIQPKVCWKILSYKSLFIDMNFIERLILIY